MGERTIGVWRQEDTVQKVVDEYEQFCSRSQKFRAIRFCERLFWVELCTKNA